MRKLSVLLLTTLFLFVGSAWAHEPSPMEAVHVTYLDVNSNFSDLLAAIDDWAGGDPSRVGLAQEKLERIQALLPHISWPDSMSGLVEQFGTALEPVGQALDSEDLATAQAGVDSAREVTHDLTHAFYEWVAETRPEPEAEE